jgi:hypothetical protein
MNTDAIAPAYPPAQPLLFDAASLPETAPARPSRRGRASAARHEGLGTDMVREGMPLPPVAVMRPAPPAPEPFDPAALTNPELRALVQALPDNRLAHLIVEAARAIKRRLVPDDPDEDGVFAEPSPELLRAARLAAGELSGEDD